MLLGVGSHGSPWWYQESQEFEEKRLWDEAMGDGFYDWYVAHVLSPPESASTQHQTVREGPVQLFLSGLGLASAEAGNFNATSF